jgi:FHA domain/FhaA, N-terminal domain
VSIARSLERRLERLFEGATGRVFSGRLHPAEMAGRIAREADLSRYEHETGPATANRYVLTVSPSDLDVDPGELQEELEAALAEHAETAGLLFEGPPTVVIRTSETVLPGQFDLEPSVAPGRLPPWSRLTGSAGTFEIGANRATVGRADDVLVCIPHDSISRRHALIWRTEGQSWIRDLGSANGTTVDGVRIGSEPVRLQHGAVVGLADLRFRFLEG